MLITSFSMIPTVIMVGLASDFGLYYFSAISARTSAESAAMAAVRSAMDDVAAGGSYTCGSNGLTCQSESACPTSIATPVTNNLNAGCLYAITNGFTNGGANSQTVTMEANITSPSPNVPGVAVTYWVTARVTQQNRLTFLAAVGGTTLQVKAKVTAAVISGPVSSCVVALDPSSSKAITITGGSTVATSCGVAAASSSSDALDVSGGATLTAGAVQVNGGYAENGCTTCISPAPTTGAVVSNPYASLPVPTFSISCDSLHTNYTLGNGSATISPGTYCGGITVIGGTLTLSAGTYVMYGGGFNQSSTSTSVTGTGVTIYNTCNPSPCNGGSKNYSPITMSGGVVDNISAPTSGSYAGILMFEDPTVSTNSNNIISGDSTACFIGVMYFKNTNVQYSGGSSNGNCNTAIAADTVTITGGSRFSSNWSNGSGGPSAPTAFFIQ